MFFTFELEMKYKLDNDNKCTKFMNKFMYNNTIYLSRDTYYINTNLKCLYDNELCFLMTQHYNYDTLRTQTHFFVSLSFDGKLCYVKHFVISCHV